MLVILFPDIIKLIQAIPKLNIVPSPSYLYTFIPTLFENKELSATIQFSVPPIFIPAKL